MVWACQCSDSNQDDWIMCPKCGTRRSVMRPTVPPDGQHMSSGTMNTGWDCPRCTFTNQGAGVLCGMCGWKRMHTSSASYQHIQQPYQQHYQQPFQQPLHQPYQQPFQQPYQQPFQQPLHQQFQQSCQIQNTHPAPVAGWSPEVSPDNERRIVVLGRTGSGKSTSCNNILQATVFKSDTSGKSVTVQCQRAKCIRFGREIQLIDTPGLFDTGMTNADTTREIVKCVGMTAPGPHAFILITRIDRFTKEEQDTVEHFKNVFGLGMMRHLIVLFTRKDDLNYEGKTIHQFVRDVPQSMKELLQNCGNRYIAFNNRGTPEEKNRDVEELVNLIDNIVLNNGGQCYTTEMYEEAEKAMKKREEQLKREHEAKANMEKMKIRQEMEMKMKEMARQQEEKLTQMKAEVKKRENERASQHELEKLKLEVEAEKLKMEKELEVARRQAELDAHKKKMEIENAKPAYREEARQEVSRGKEVVIDLLKLGFNALVHGGISFLFGMAQESLSKNKSLKETHGTPSKTPASESSTSSGGNQTDEAKTSKTSEK